MNWGGYLQNGVQFNKSIVLTHLSIFLSSTNAPSIDIYHTLRTTEMNRLSKMQQQILLILSGRASDYETLRDNLMEMSRLWCAHEDSFKASFSRSLSNLVNKRLVERTGYGFRLDRTVLYFDKVKLTKVGGKAASRLLAKGFWFYNAVSITLTLALRVKSK